MDDEYTQLSREDEFINPNGVCIICGSAGLHRECEKKFLLERDDRNKDIEKRVEANNVRERELLEIYSIDGKYGPSNKHSVLNYGDAKKLVEKYDGFTHSYNESIVIENSDWWFIPYFFIGMRGYIIEKESRSVFPIGSGLGSHWDGIELYTKGELPAGNS